MSVEQLHTKNFQEKVAEKKVSIIDFWAAWCGPCRAVSPIVEKISEEKTDWSFFSVNVDEEPALSNAFQVSSIPTLLVFENGEYKGRVIGAKPKTVLESEISSLIS